MIATKNGRRREVGLGSVRKVSLSAARQKFADYHAAAAASEDKDVLDVKRERRNRLSMQEAALAYIDAMRGGWKHGKYEPRLRQLVRDHFGALLGVRFRPWISKTF